MSKYLKDPSQTGMESRIYTRVFLMPLSMVNRAKTVVNSNLY